MECEPLRLAEGSSYRADLMDLTVDLAAASAGLKRSLPPGITSALADLVRSMNCYYSNLIEGHDTHPVDIERALAEDFSANLEKRNLQLEARAHVEVQQWIDAGGLNGSAYSIESLRAIHKRFCTLLPAEMLRVRDPDTGKEEQLIPGEFRYHDVKVGRHVPISPGAVPRVLERFEEAYSRLGTSEAILAAAAAHHRLLWIHPFLDGNGRVARLMSHSILLDTLDTGGIWSIARGLARNDAAYKAHLMDCDQPRRNDLDGRGALSEEALTRFTRFFLETCLDQVRFMENLVQPNTLRKRILAWVSDEIERKALPAKAGLVLDAVLYRGTLPRGETPLILDRGERQARRIVVALEERGVLKSETPRGALRLAFPAVLAPQWMPGLFPEKA